MREAVTCSTKTMQEENRIHALTEELIHIERELIIRPITTLSTAE